MSAVNPFDVYLSQLVHQFYRTPTDGFRGRLVALLVLTGLHIFLAIIYLALNVQALLSGGGGVWMFRQIRRGSSSYGVFNARLLGPICTIIWGAIAIGYIADSKRVFCDGGDYTTATWVLRGIQWIPLFGAGWLVSSSFLQAYFLASSEMDGRKLSSRQWNYILLISGLSLFALQLGLATWAIVVSVQLWDQYTIFHQLLTKLSSEWTGVLDASALASLSQPYNRFLESADRFRTATTVQYTTLFLLPLGCLLLNLGGLFLARRLHHQASAQIERLTTGTYNIELSLEGDSASSPPPPILEPDRRGSVSTNALRKLATKKHAEGEVGLELASTQAAEALEMLKAKSDLVTNCISIGAGSTVILGSAVYIAVIVGRNEFVTGNWASFEAALFSITWEMDLILPVIYAVLIANDLLLGRVHHARGENGSRRPSAATVGSDALMSEIA